MAQYPPTDVDRASGAGRQRMRQSSPLARIVHVEPGSPADDAGFEPGCAITSVDGHPLRDIIDWRWHACSSEVEVGYIDLDGDEGTVLLWREPGEDWGFEFDGLVFDEVRQCRNNCTFCFMHQLPRGMRRSLYLRDDDFRLSFLVGTFVTLTNMEPADEARIIEQRISPLRVSLQATNAHVRRRLIGRNADRGIQVLDRLLDAGIEFHAQIVLVPGENDGEVLRETLAWAYERPGILNVGIVPLGYTCHQDRFSRSFNHPSDAHAVLQLIEPFQRRAHAERGHAWVFAADEFYRNAYGGHLLGHLPDASHYGDFSLFEDGIGIIRSTVDDWERAVREGLASHCAAALRAANVQAFLVAGFAQREFLTPLVAQAGMGDCLHPLYVRNDYFGGNVDVTGLLTARDVVKGVVECAARVRAGGEDEIAGSCVPAHPLDCRTMFLVPRVMFNDDGVTLDDETLQDMEETSGCELHMVSCSPMEYLEEIAALARETE